MNELQRIREGTAEVVDLASAFEGGGISLPDVAEALTGNNTLQILYLSHNNITDISALAQALEGNTTLQGLYLSHNNITDISDLAKALVGNTTLQWLNLSDNKITDISALAKALAGNTTLQGLYLSNNNITDIRALAKALADNTTLQWLYLSNNNITDISALAQALTGNTTLQVLSLSNNKITDISALAQALTDNTTLQGLYLEDNTITDISALAKALAGNTTLQRLHLFSNNITDISALAKALAGNTTLQGLSVSNNNITDISALASIDLYRHCNIAMDLRNAAEFIVAIANASSVIDDGLVLLPECIPGVPARLIDRPDLFRFVRDFPAQRGLHRQGYNVSRTLSMYDERAMPGQVSFSRAVAIVQQWRGPSEISTGDTGDVNTLSIQGSCNVLVQAWIKQWSWVLGDGSRTAPPPSADCAERLLHAMRSCGSQEYTTSDLVADVFASCQPLFGQGEYPCYASSGSIDLSNLNLERMPLALIHVLKTMMDRDDGSIIVDLSGNPALLRKVPVQFRDVPKDAITFLHDLASGGGSTVRLLNVRLVLAGEWQAGKSTAAQRLKQAAEGRLPPSLPRWWQFWKGGQAPPPLPKPDPTVGIDLGEVAVPARQGPRVPEATSTQVSISGPAAGSSGFPENLHITILDLAGDDVYAAAHAMFIDENCVFAFVWNVTVDPRAQGQQLHTWANYLADHAPGAGVILVGSHIDEMNATKTAVARVAEVQRQFQEMVSVDGHDKLNLILCGTFGIGCKRCTFVTVPRGAGGAALRDIQLQPMSQWPDMVRDSILFALEKACIDRALWEEVPVRYGSLAADLADRREKRDRTQPDGNEGHVDIPVMTVAAFKDLEMCRSLDVTSLRLALRYLHQRSILYFVDMGSDDESIVFLDMGWIVDIFYALLWWQHYDKAHPNRKPLTRLPPGVTRQPRDRSNGEAMDRALRLVCSNDPDRCQAEMAGMMSPAVVDLLLGTMVEPGSNARVQVGTLLATCGMMVPAEVQTSSTGTASTVTKYVAPFLRFSGSRAKEIASPDVGTTRVMVVLTTSNRMEHLAPRIIGTLYTLYVSRSGSTRTTVKFGPNGGAMMLTGPVSQDPTLYAAVLWSTKHRLEIHISQDLYNKNVLSLADIIAPFQASLSRHEDGLVSEPHLNRERILSVFVHCGQCLDKTALSKALAGIPDTPLCGCDEPWPFPTRHQDLADQERRLQEVRQNLQRKEQTLDERGRRLAEAEARSQTLAQFRHQVEAFTAEVQVLYETNQQFESVVAALKESLSAGNINVHLGPTLEEMHSVVTQAVKRGSDQVTGAMREMFDEQTTYLTKLITEVQWNTSPSMFIAVPKETEGRGVWERVTDWFSSTSGITQVDIHLMCATPTGVHLATHRTGADNTQCKCGNRGSAQNECTGMCQRCTCEDSERCLFKPFTISIPPDWMVKMAPWIVRCAQFLAVTISLLPVPVYLLGGSVTLAAYIRAAGSGASAAPRAARSIANVVTAADYRDRGIHPDKGAVRLLLASPEMRMLEAKLRHWDGEQGLGVHWHGLRPCLSPSQDPKDRAIIWVCEKHQATFNRDTAPPVMHGLPSDPPPFLDFTSDAAKPLVSPGAAPSSNTLYIESQDPLLVTMLQREMDRTHADVPGGVSGRWRPKITKVKVLYNPVLDQLFHSCWCKFKDEDGMRAQALSNFPDLFQYSDEGAQVLRVLKTRHIQASPQWARGVPVYHDAEIAPKVNLDCSWHGASAEVLRSIGSTGFLNLALRNPGFFGRGTYLTHHAEYAHMYPNGLDVHPEPGPGPLQEHELLMCYSILGRPYPVTRFLMGQTHAPREPDTVVTTTHADQVAHGINPGHDSHYVLVDYTAHHATPAISDYTRKDSHGLVQYKFDELCIGEDAQLLPRYLVTYVNEGARG